MFLKRYISLFSALLIFLIFVFIGYCLTDKTKTSITLAPTSTSLPVKVPPAPPAPKAPVHYQYSSLPFKPFCDDKHRFDRRYLALSMVAISAGNGIGNRLFEIFALRGLAKRLNRTAIFNSDDFYLMKQITEMKKTVPQILEGIEILPIEASNSSRYTLFRQAQVYQYHKLFECDKSKFLVLDGFLYQSHRYFPEIKQEIISMFDLEGEKKQQIESLVDEKDKNKFKSCVHVRRGDFKNSGFLEASDASFTQKAINFLRKTHKGIVYIFSNDPDWVKTSVYEKLDAKDELHIQNMTSKSDAINDIYFSRLWCDAVMITAPASTFGWWMGYVAKSKEYIYYRDFFDTGDTIRWEMVLEDYFYPSWIKIGYDENKEIIIKS